MKLKKFLLVSGLSVTTLMFSSCGSDIKSEFIKTSSDLTKKNTQEFNMKTDDLKFVASGQANSYAPIVNGYLSSFKLSGKSIQDGKKEKMALELSLSDESIPLELISDGSNSYLKLESVKPFISMYLNFNGVDSSNLNIDYSKLENKYLDTNKILDEQTENTEGELSLSQKDNQKALENTYNTLDKKFFNKKGSAITLTLSGDEVSKFIKKYKSELPKKTREALNKQMKDIDLEKSISETIKELDITTDKKNEEMKIVIKFTGKKVNGYGFDGKISYATKYSNSKSTVKIPLKQNIIDNVEELETLISNSFKVDISE